MNKEQALAFRPELYEQAKSQQIVDDLTSYLGEYRFNVPEFNYKIKISSGRLLDPNTEEDMEDKAQKAIEERQKNGLSAVREVAEKEGLSSIANQLVQNPTGTVIWFSPPGLKEDGYGEYGFAFVGKAKGNMLEMTAIRLEKPKIADFNVASNALWGEEYKSAEDFLRSSKVVNEDPLVVKDFILGNFEIRDQKTKEVFRKSLNKLKGGIDQVAKIIQSGTEKEKRSAINTLENLAIEIKGKLESSFNEQIIFLEDFKLPDFALAMRMQKYQTAPPPIPGSCGMTGKIESSNIFGKLFNSDSNLSKNSQEWFNCPKCSYKADGPVGNTCPGCGLTKEQYAQESGEICE